MALTLVFVCVISFVWAYFSRSALEKLVDDLQRRDAEQRDLLAQLCESWRADCERHHQKTVEAVKAMLHEQVPFDTQGHPDGFNRALATEVRILLAEVGRIREERRALQHEIADLLSMKAKYGPGGEHGLKWKPAGPVPPSPSGKGKQKTAESPPAASTLAQQYPPTPSSPKMHTTPPWTYVHTPADVKRQSTQLWEIWQPEHNEQVTPPPEPPTLIAPGRESPELFGPMQPEGLA